MRLTLFQLRILQMLADGATITRPHGGTQFVMRYRGSEHLVPVRAGITHMHEHGMVVETTDSVTITDKGREAAKDAEKVAELLLHPWGTRPEGT